MVLVPLLMFMVCFQGCDLEQLADSLIFESANQTLGSHWTDKQRDMYFVIAKLDREKCIELLTDAGVRFINDPVTRSMVDGPGTQVAVSVLMDPSLPELSREEQISTSRYVSGAICLKLAQYLVLDNELLDTAARSAAIDSANDQLKAQLTEEQRKQYFVLFELGLDGCVQEISGAYVKLVADTGMHWKLNSRGKTTIETVVARLSPTERAALAQHAAKLVCNNLMRSYLHPEEGRLD